MLKKKKKQPWVSDFGKEKGTGVARGECVGGCG